MTVIFNHQLSLNDYFKTHNVDLTETIAIFIAIVQQINRFHTKQIVHKDINPTNIRIDEHTHAISLLDSTIAFDISRATPAPRPVPPPKIQGDIAFIAPELTGRTAHAIDFRTDFYSLGVVFYQSLTGTLPFDFKDPLEIIHGHVAEIPIYPHKIKAAIPIALSEITMKLLAKDPQDRYQSAAGLITDLEICLRQLHAKGKIDPFPLAEKDVSPVLVFPERLYGRYKETQLLLEAFSKVKSGGVEALFFSGPPGIGKSFLINEIRPYLIKDNGFFISGKYDPDKCDIPYSAFIGALNELMRQLLTVSDRRLDYWKEKILEAIGKNGQIIIDVIPDIERIIGTQPTVAPVSPAKTQNRFNYVFQNFVKSLTTKENPIILFLDDLQWADSASLELLKVIFSEAQLSHLLFIGAYRDIEVNDNPFFKLFSERLSAQRIKTRFIDLEPVDDEYVSMLLEDVFAIDSNENDGFSRLIADKTNGNPLFIKEFLISLEKSGLIYYIHPAEDQKARGWSMDLNAIREAGAGISDNIVELLTARIKKLTNSTQRVLKIAACIGARFSFDILDQVFRKTDKKGITDLQEALIQGMIVETGEGFRFIHDRIHESFYNLTSESEKYRMHYEIGKSLQSMHSKQNPGREIFEIVYQLNLVSDLLTENEKKELCALNYEAGRKAKAKTAYDTALHYFKNTIAFLTEDSWQSHYAFTLRLYEDAAEAAYLGGKFDEMTQLIAVVLRQCHSDLDKVNSFEIQINALTAQNKLREAIDVGRQALNRFDDNLPEAAPTLDDLVHYHQKIQQALSGKNISHLANLPENENPRILAITQICASLLSAAYWYRPTLISLLVLKITDMSISYGNCNKSTYAYASYGSILCIIGESAQGYEFGRLALRLIEQRNEKEEAPKTQCVLNGLLWHWQDHVNKTLSPLFAAYRNALKIGDNEFAAYNIGIYCGHSMHIGKPLTEVAQLLAQYSPIIEKLKQHSQLYLIKKFHQTLLYLMGEAPYPNRLAGTHYNQDVMLPLHVQHHDNFNIFFVYFCNLILNYTFQNYQAAYNNVCLAEDLVMVDYTTMNSAIYNLYNSLTRLALCGDLAAGETKQHLEKVVGNQQKLKYWAQIAPMNYRHKWALVEAEYNRILGQEQTAVHYYHQAIDGARENEYIHEQALANELAAAFFFARGKAAPAESHLREAFTLYEKWGAKGKLRQLERKHGHLVKTDTLPRTPRPISLVPPIASQPPATLHLSGLDFQLLTETLSDISTSDDVNHCLEKLSTTIMKCAGAEKVLLLLYRNGELSIGIDCQTGKETIQTFKPVDANVPVFPAKLITYVIRTRKTIILDNASETAPFASDPYIRKHQVKSVVCMPIMYQGNPTALLYLENNLNRGVFVTQHQHVLQGLAGPIALFLENELLKEQQRLTAGNPSAPPLSLTDILEHEYRMTPQEALISFLLKEGYSRSQICDELNILPETLKSHLKKIYRKALPYEKSFQGYGRIDKLSRLIIFLYKLSDHDVTASLTNQP